MADENSPADPGGSAAGPGAQSNPPPSRQAPEPAAADRPTEIRPADDDETRAMPPVPSAGADDETQVHAPQPPTGQTQAYTPPSYLPPGYRSDNEPGSPYSRPYTAAAPNQPPASEHGGPPGYPPAYGQPYSQEYNAAYGQSAYGQPPNAPGYGAPNYGSSPYDAPAYGQPQYGQPAYGQAAYGQAGYQQPSGSSGYSPPAAPTYGGYPTQQYGQASTGPEYSRGDDDRALRYDAEPEAGSKRSLAWLWAVLVAVVVVAIVAIALVLTKPSFLYTKKLSHTAVEQTIEQQSKGRGDFTQVSCPSGQKAETGVTFTCSAAGDKKISVRVTSNNGDYTWSPG